MSVLCQIDVWHHSQGAGDHRLSLFERQGLRREAYRRLQAMLSQNEPCHDGEVIWEATDNGKPYHHVAGCCSRWQWNMSYGGRQVALVCIEGATVGVDIEPMRPRSWSTRRLRWLSTCEQAWLQACDSAEVYTEVFYQLWTAKEALIKWLGVGFWRSIADIHLEREADGRLRPKSQCYDLSRVSLWRAVSPGWMMTLATEGDLDCSALNTPGAWRWQPAYLP